MELLQEMRKQLKLDNDKFTELLSCEINDKQYIKILKDKGIIL